MLSRFDRADRHSRELCEPSNTPGILRAHIRGVWPAGCGPRRGGGVGVPLASSQLDGAVGSTLWQLCASATRRSAHANCVRSRPSPAPGITALT